MSVDLNSNGAPTQVGTVTLRTPGLTGTAEAHPPGTPGMRAAELSTDALEGAFVNEHVEAQESIELTETREVDVSGVPTRGTTHGEPAIELEVADPGEQWGQFVLYTDESGVTTWNFARTETGEIDATRGTERRVYVIRRYVPQPSAEPGTRGLIGAIGKKVLKVLVFPLLDPVVGQVGDYFAARWERKKRPYRLRTFTPDDYRMEEAGAIDDEAWRKLAGGRSLLLVHGTFSRAHTAFGGLPREFVTQLHRLYGGRVFAFDHFTLSEDPSQNGEWLIQQVPDGQELELDIVCHSRGGLVSRMLAEKQGELSVGSRRLRVRRVVFVASPNSGTILTDPRYMGDLIDSYTNILNFFPDVGVTDLLEGIITVAKQLAVATLKGLEGLQSMRPGGEFLGQLNKGARGEARYYALGADFEPTDPGLHSYAKDRLMDHIFRTGNDLVVPTASVWEANGSDLFPIEDRLLFHEADGVYHGGFFVTPAARNRILDWLRA